MKEQNGSQNKEVKKNRLKVVIKILILAVILLYLYSGLSLIPRKKLDACEKSDSDCELFNKYCDEGATLIRNYRTTNDSAYDCYFGPIYLGEYNNEKAVAEIRRKIEDYCESNGFNFSSFGHWGEILAVCYRFMDKNKICTDGNQCESGFCTPDNKDCITNCKGKCEIWDENSPSSYVDPSCGDSIYYLENGKLKIYFEGICQ